MGRERAADEVFCRSCGRAIGREVEVCPHCGVPNDVRHVPSDDRRGDGTDRPQSQSGDSTRQTGDATGTADARESQLTGETAGEASGEPDASTSDKSGERASEGERPDSHWRYGVAAAIALWIGLFLVGGVFRGSIVLTAAVFLVWVTLPVTVLLDARALQAADRETPTPALWALATAVPVLNLLFGAIYLYRRHEALRDR